MEIKVGYVKASWDEYYQPRAIGDHAPVIEFKDDTGVFMTVPTALIDAIARQL